MLNLESCIEQLAGDFWVVAFPPWRNSATWIGEAVIITAGQKSTETISELKIWKYGIWYVEHLFAEFSNT